MHDPHIKYYIEDKAIEASGTPKLIYQAIIEDSENMNISTSMLSIYDSIPIAYKPIQIDYYDNTRIIRERLVAINGWTVRINNQYLPEG